jgi:hypothetical protein
MAGDEDEVCLGTKVAEDGPVLAGAKAAMLAALKAAIRSV